MQEGKWKCWDIICSESGEHSPLEVVQWARDPWSLKARIRRLKVMHGSWWDTDEDKVCGLVSDQFGEMGTAYAEVDEEGHTGCKTIIEVVMGYVKMPLPGTKNNSSSELYEVRYKLLQAVKDTKLRGEVLMEVR